MTDINTNRRHFLTATGFSLVAATHNPDAGTDIWTVADSSILAEASGTGVARDLRRRPFKPGVGTVFLAQGYSSSGDGGGGAFYWDPSSVASDDGGLIFNPVGNPGPGRWHRLIDREAIDVRWFGPALDGITDDTASWQAAIDALGPRGGVIACPNKPSLIDRNLYVRHNVILRGSAPNPGEEPQSWNYAADDGALIINPNCSIHFGNNSGMSNMWVVRKGLVESPKDAGTAAAQVAAFAGIALSLEGSDVVLEWLNIVGFDWAVYHQGKKNADYERPRLRYVNFDCTNGISIGLSGDLGDIYGCHGFPFYTAHRGFPNGVNGRRGIAFQSRPVHDWATWTNCNAFGWATTFDITDCNNVMLVNCSGDGVLEAGIESIGFNINGACQDVALIGCRAAARGTAYKINNRGHVRLIGCSAWGSGRHLWVTGTANGLLSGNHFWYLQNIPGFYKPICAVEFGKSAGNWSIIGNTFEDEPRKTYPSVYALHEMRPGSVKSMGNTYINCSATEEGSTGWAAPSGVARRSGYNTHSATLTEVAETLKALIDDLHAHGVIGS